MNMMIIESSEWLIVLLGSALWLCAGVSVSMPWFSAHFAFWGCWENDDDDIEFACRLSGLCLAYLSFPYSSSGRRSPCLRPRCSRPFFSLP